ncbi:MAG: dienelactone hydrolase family protein [Xanthobacteraceae bacterium]|nr:dienelactone hydrolase family protein [Xanthobacteraceae bacterium]
MPAAAKIIGLAMMLATLAHPSLAQERVTFPGADGKTTLSAYVFMPAKSAPAKSAAPKSAAPERAARMPAVVMMHGRGGVYSKAAKGRYAASTISQRHRMWGELWAANGYVAVLVDSFGPRGYPAGFPRFSYDTRPDAVNEVTVRPLDAYGALAWLRARADIDGNRVGLQGWSNGGSAALATMAAGTGYTPAPVKGFNAALVFYPACRLRGRFDDGYRPYAPVRVFHGTADEETSPRRCNAFVEKSRKSGGDITMTLYPGAVHGFDDPGRARQADPANAKAKADATARALRFFAEQLRPPSSK